MRTLLAVLLAAFAASAYAQTYVKPHVRSNGTYVEGHMRSSPNNTRTDNWSSTGNQNPYTGSQGTTNPYNPNPYAK